ncbi:hypothetical protein HYC85_000267 [Camellia sinensis]|uniref:Uncharacterized protein n=1 Tax=Camellia sinensis TaxID=4442 RepID=A0A7J7I4M0_CAMSI|nr:hypothetical protein HYC85_000267 [Camellia sinensis]
MNLEKQWCCEMLEVKNARENDKDHEYGILYEVSRVKIPRLKRRILGSNFGVSPLKRPFRHSSGLRDFCSYKTAGCSKSRWIDLWRFARDFLITIGGAPIDIREKKLVHKQAVELVKFLCDQIASANYSTARKIFSLSLEQATSVGIYEIVQEILKSYPDAISLQNWKEQSIFHQAIVCHREQVFNLARLVGKSRTVFLGQCDDSQNNALHLVGFLAPQEQLYRGAGTALQMQCELQWFKEVEKHTQGSEKRLRLQLRLRLRLRLRSP